MSLNYFIDPDSSPPFAPDRKILSSLHFTIFYTITFARQISLAIFQLRNSSHTLADIFQISSSFATRIPLKYQINRYDGVTFQETQKDLVHSYVVYKFPEVSPVCSEHCNLCLPATCPGQVRYGVLRCLGDVWGVGVRKGGKL